MHTLRMTRKRQLKTHADRNKRAYTGAEAEDEDQSNEVADVETQAVNKYATMQ